MVVSVARFVTGTEKAQAGAPRVFRVSEMVSRTDRIGLSGGSEPTTRGRVAVLREILRPMRSFRESEQALHDAARAQVGHDDFGDDAYLEGLRALLGSLDDDARLTPVGDLAIRGTLIDALKGRLHSERGWAASPACATVAILAAVVAAPTLIRSSWNSAL